MKPALLRSPLVLFALLAVPVLAADSKNGQTLYESRCTECHKETTMIGPDGPKAKTLEGVRLQVQLWNSLVGGIAWSEKDIADVVAYLNAKFYRY
jgi:mono/diheme cytochrome c family protein